MTYKFYDEYEEVPRALDDSMEFDSTSCQLGICCKDNHNNRTAVIGAHLRPDGDGVDKPVWSPFAAFKATSDESGDPPVLTCPDCADWLVDAIEELEKPAPGSSLHELVVFAAAQDPHDLDAAIPVIARAGGIPEAALSDAMNVYFAYKLRLERIRQQIDNKQYK